MGHTVSEEQRKKVSAALKGIAKSEEHKHKTSEYANNRSEEHKRNLSKAQKLRWQKYREAISKI